METAAASTEITMLAWSVILLLVQIVVQGLFANRDVGMSYLMSARDEARRFSTVTDRLSRCLRNFLETYPAFVGLALALAVTGQTGGMGAAGAVVWFGARVVYIPVFAAGIPVLRTVVWVISIIGLAMMLVQLMS